MGKQRTFEASEDPSDVAEMGFSQLSNFVTGLHEVVSSLCSSSVNEYPSRKPKRSQKMNKSVSFGDLEIRSYPVILGDNPFCHSGCPLQLDWTYVEQRAMAIDEYENARVPRRHHSILRTTWKERQEILSTTMPDLLTAEDRDDLAMASQRLTRCKLSVQNLFDLPEVRQETVQS